ncbi:cytidylyltransferase domain-containing protein [Polynucleobacter necessarius]|uniref:acylneuraminate cytidylyltransferase family protein n=1 Tax=Polynucleobacter necessarius TaxID=576610 RepID=UPI000E096F33|nr:acylneuraminate cytidylyltransferase family protein [Polynucleobacter necessarius]HAT39093.1 acylneuraminate cytidylyltransferase [Polynucleobacter sp.]
MNPIAFIFARAGSKGLPGKNIRQLAGKPLIAWSIEQALAVKRIKQVIVSTDSPEIAEVALQYGAKVPFIRPAEFSQDESPEWLAWKHALNHLYQTSKELPDVMISVPVTAPLRIPQDIENCLNVYEQGEVDVVITVANAHRSPYFNMVTKNPDNTVELVIPWSSSIVRRQDAPTVYDMTTVCYAASPKFVLNNNSIFEGRVKSTLVPIERSIDIDTIYDFKIAELLMKERLSNQGKDYA